MSVETENEAAVPYEWTSREPIPWWRESYYYVMRKLWWHYPPSGGWLHPRKWYRETKWFVQRGRRGWADSDVWSLNHYLARVIAESVDSLREQSHGYPGTMYDEENRYNLLGAATHALVMPGDEDEYHDRWKAILDVISHAFRDYNKLDDEIDASMTPEMYKARKMQIEEDMKLFLRYYDGLWD